MTIEDDFEKLSPPIDDVMQRIGELPLSQFEKAALASLLLTRMAVFARHHMMAALHSDEPIGDPDERNRIASLLMKTTEEAEVQLADLERAYEDKGSMQ